MPPDPTGTLRFGVDARHIRQLGRELVGDRVTAVSELIKNSYDADATEVLLHFTNAEEVGGTLEVLDDGNGMSFEALQNGWMRISTAEKEKESVSPGFHRTRAGRKGIGRFATETLGQRLRLESTAAGETKLFIVEFDWDSDYPEGSELTLIDNPYFAENAPAEEHYTMLRIEGLYDPWNLSARSRVQRAVRLLQPPFPVADGQNASSTDPGFRVGITVDGQNQPVEDAAYEEFREAATATVTAEIDRNGEVSVHIVAPLFGLDQREPLKEKFSAAGAFRLEAAYYVFRPEALGAISRKIALAMAERYSGMRIYRDGLRVMPYGEPDTDWLGLDELSASRTQVLAPVATMNWFGQVMISRDTNPALRDTASREGFVVTPAYDALRAATRAVLIKTAREVAAVRNRKPSTRDKPSRPSREEVLAQARDQIQAAAQAELPPTVAAQMTDLVTRTLQLTAPDAKAADLEERSTEQSLIDEIELLRVLASLGTAVTVFSHEVRAALNAASGAITVLIESGQEGKELESAQRALNELRELAGYIDASMSLSQRRERAPIPMSAVLSDFTTRLSTHLARTVEFEVEVEPRGLRTQGMARSEFESVLINLLTNAIKAMDSEGGQRKIGISAKAFNGDVVIRFQDTGAGIRPELAPRIFDAFVTDRASTISELGAGTGLGLKIVADILEANAGSIKIAQSTPPFKTCFEVRLPRWSEQL